MPNLGKTFPKEMNRSEICPKWVSDTLIPGSKEFSLLAASHFLLKVTSYAKRTFLVLYPFLVCNHSYNTPWPSDSIFQPNAILWTDEQLWTQLQKRNPLAIGDITAGTVHIQMLAQGQEHGLYENLSLINCVPNLPLKGVLKVKCRPDSWNT